MKLPKTTKPEIKKLETPKFVIKKPNIKNMNLKKYSLRNLNFKLILILIKKELFNFFSTPIAYIVIGLFIIVVAILFFSVGNFLLIGTSDLSNLFAYISFTFAIIVPAITMGSISRERQSGTIEYLLTQPLTEFQLLLSKFLAYSMFIVLLLITTLPLVVMIGTFGTLDVGQIIMQYIGALILGMCLVSLGMAISALMKSEIASFLITVVLAAILIIVGSDLLQLNFGISFILERIGLLSHYQSISRGVLDIRDVLYFIAFILAFLSIAYYLLIKDKFPAKSKSLRYSQVSLVILIILMILIGYIGQLIPGRIDFTSNKVYTLSQASVNVINQINDVMNVKLYASSNLPIQFQSQLRNVKDMLRDYQIYSAGKINYTFIPTSNTTDSDNEAAKAGLQPIRFQVNSSDSSQVAIGFFGLTISYLDKTELLNLNDQLIVDNLEYNITKKINKLSNANLKTIGFVKDFTTYSLEATNLKTFTTEAGELFKLEEVDLTSAIPESINTLVIAGPSGDLNADQQKRIKDFYSNGGNVFFLTNPVNVSADQTGINATNNDKSLNTLFSDYGITVNQNLVYDLQNNNYVNAGYLFPSAYPLWVNAQSTKENISILKDVNQVSYLWGSSISIDSSKTKEIVYKLLQTSTESNIQEAGSYSVDPKSIFSKKDNDGIQLLAVAIQNSNNGKAVIIGDAKLISDDNNLVRLEENLAFGLSSLEWLSGSDSIASIQAKVRTAPRISLSPNQTTTLSVIGIGFPIAAVVTIGIIRFYFRKKKQSRKYE